MNREDSVNELKKTYSKLGDDIDFIQELYSKDPSKTLARALARSYSAYIEGTLYQLRQVAISSAKSVPELYTNEEWAILLEKQPYLNKKGEIETKDSFERFLPMLLFTLQQYVKVHGASFKPNTGDNRWDDMKKFVGFRNRLMHPKSDKDLEFEMLDLNSMMDAVNWFHDTSLEMFNACKKSDALHRKNT